MEQEEFLIKEIKTNSKNRSKMVFLNVELQDSDMSKIISQSFHQKIQYFDIDFNLHGTELTISIRSNKKSIKDKDAHDLFYNIYDLIFLCAGRYPPMIKCNYKNDSEFVAKYATSEKFKYPSFIYKTIDDSVITQQNIEDIKKFNNKNYSLYSFEYITCQEYDVVLWEHKLTLLLHVIDGVFDCVKDCINIDTKNILEEFCKKYKASEKIGEYMPRLYYMMSKYYFNRQDISLPTIKLLKRKNEFSFLQALEQTRNWYSHMLNKNSLSSRISPTDRNFAYVYIVYSVLRQMILQEYFRFSLDEKSIRESLAIIHDWLLPENRNFSALLSASGKVEFVSRQLSKIPHDV